MTAFGCARRGCGATICLTPEIERRMRRTHESFVCPFGHSQSFSSETDQEAAWRVERQGLIRARDRWREIAEEREEVFGTCPFGCGWRSRSGMNLRWLQMFKHFTKAHGNMLPTRMVWAARRENQEKSA